MENVELKFLGKQYRGSDPVTGKNISLVSGSIILVSKQKADQLLKDFPLYWALVSVEVKKEELPVEPKVIKRTKKVK